MARTTPPLPLPARRALRKLGRDLRNARRRRRISTAVMADRVMVSRPTLARMEQGDPAVSMGTYATALFVLGMIDSLGDLADAGRDVVGRSLEEESLPERIHMNTHTSRSRKR